MYIATDAELYIAIIISVFFVICINLNLNDDNMYKVYTVYIVHALDFLKYELIICNNRYRFKSLLMQLQQAVLKSEKHKMINFFSGASVDQSDQKFQIFLWIVVSKGKWNKQHGQVDYWWSVCL